MTFTVRYRGKDGSLREEVVEAADRAACVAACRARGIAPINVAEGGRASSRAATGGRASTRAESAGGDSKRTAARWAAAVAAVAAVGVGVWWWLAARPPVAAKPVVEVRPEARPLRPRDAKSAPAKPAPAKPAPAKPTPKPAAADTNAQERVPSAPPPGTVLSVRTNDNNLVITEVVGPNGKKKLLTTELRKPVFSNPADQLIAAAMNASMTGQMAPLPLGPEADLYFKEAMKRPIPDDPDDTEEVKRMKQAVRETREEIARLMEQGQTFAEILEQHRELWNENVRIRESVVAEYRKIVRSGDEEEARRYMERMNASLGQMGIPPLTESDGHSKKRKRKEEVQQ